MKKDIHPTLHPVVFVDISCGKEFVTMSTMTSEEKKKIKGVDHYVVRVEVSSASHPFYTGKKMLVDTAGRVDKFNARQKAAAKLKEQHDARMDKRDSKKKETVEERIAVKAKENTIQKAEEKAKRQAAEKIKAKKASDKFLVTEEKEEKTETEEK